MVVARRCFFSLVLIFLAACGGSVATEATYQSPFFDQKGNPSADLVALLAKLEIPCELTRESIVQQTQKKWIQQPGTERFYWQDGYAGRMPALKPLLQNLGLIDDVLPKQQSYDYALVHGATIVVMRARLAFLAGLWQKGIRFKTLVLLTGQRDLDPVHDSFASLTNNPERVPMQPGWQPDEAQLQLKTETDAMHVLYEHVLMPEAMRNVPMVLVDAPKTLQPDGLWRRPTTRGTIETWLQKQPKPGSCLAVSNQPFKGYQDLVVRTLLPASFSLETVGFAVPADYESVVMCLDSLARWLYQEQQYLMLLSA